jgi:protein gp37
MPTKISWANEVLNVTSGCTHASFGCQNCYAERMAKRLKGMGIQQYQTVVNENGWTGKVVVNMDVLERPRHWIKPRRIFVDSMADLFVHNDAWLPTEFYVALFSVMLATPQHTYVLLTKRPLQAANRYRVIKNYLSKHLDAPFPWPLPNAWLGVSIENNDWAYWRVSELLKIPAALHFVSCEPLLGAIDLAPWIDKLGWVCAGCESGPGRRPALANWFYRLREQCVEANVPFFLKQMEIDGKLVHMPAGLNGVVWNQIPERKA